MKTLVVNQIVFARFTVPDRKFFKLQQCMVVKQLNKSDYYPEYAMAFEGGYGCIKPVDIKDRNGKCYAVQWQAFRVNYTVSETDKQQLELKERMLPPATAWSLENEHLLYCN